MTASMELLNLLNRFKEYYETEKYMEAVDLVPGFVKDLYQLQPQDRVPLYADIATLNIYMYLYCTSNAREDGVEHYFVIGVPETDLMLVRACLYYSLATHEYLRFEEIVRSYGGDRNLMLSIKEKLTVNGSTFKELYDAVDKNLGSAVGKNRILAAVGRLSYEETNEYSEYLEDMFKINSSNKPVENIAIDAIKVKDINQKKEARKSRNRSNIWIWHDLDPANVQMFVASAVICIFSYAVVYKLNTAAHNSRQITSCSDGCLFWIFALMMIGSLAWAVINGVIILWALLKRRRKLR